MKVRKKQKPSGSDKVELQMTPMIDIVFQLLVFFILTFKVVAQEGDFDIRMPIMGAPQEQLEQAEKETLNVRLEASGSGRLARLILDDAIIPGDKASDKFKELHRRILGKLEQAGGPDKGKMMEVEFECDYNLHYRNVVGAITAVSGQKNKQNEIVKLIEQIKFAPPKR
jgi:biopolymer transport protein ExbD